MKIERRGGRPAEVRMDGDAISVEGHAAVFDQWADIAGLFRERVAPGAFASALSRGDDVVFQIEHAGLPLARTRSGTLTLSEDDQGLLMRSDLDASDPDVARIAPKMRRGDLDKMSFGFVVRGEEWREADDMPERTITDVELFDVSIVTFPAYDGTDIAMRSMRDALRASDRRMNQERRRKIARAVDLFEIAPR